MPLPVDSGTLPSGPADYTEEDTPIAAKYTASLAGTLNNIRIHGNGTQVRSTGCWLGTYRENGGTSGTLLGPAEFVSVSATNAWFNVGRLSIAVRVGTAYWIAAVPPGTNAQISHDDTASSGGTDTRASSVSTRTDSSPMVRSYDWVTSYPIGPFAMCGDGVAGGAAPPPGRQPLPQAMQSSAYR